MSRLHLCKYPGLILLMVAIFSTKAYAQDTVRRTAGLYGKIKSITQYNYAIEGGDNGVEADELAFKVVQLFDEDGNCNEEYRYAADGMLKGKVVYKYHPLSGRLVEERHYDANAKYKYSENHHYDPRGNEIMRKSIKSDKNLFLKATMEYDEQNNILQEKTCSPGGRVLSRALWKYDSRNNPIEETTYDPDQGQTRKSTYKYDDRNNLIEEKNTYYDLSVTTTYKWDTLTRLTEECHYTAEGRVEKVVKHTYDERNEETEQTTFAGDGILLKKMHFTYTYDAHNNLIKKIQTENEKDIILFHREIAYY